MASDSSDPNIIFEVAFSFAGANRDRILRIATLVKKKLGEGKVFYDDWFKRELGSGLLDINLQRIYSRNSRLIVIALSRAYNDRPWTQMEWETIRELRHAASEVTHPTHRYRFVYIRFDSAKVRGFTDLRRYDDARELTDQQLADEILSQLELLKNAQAEAKKKKPLGNIAATAPAGLDKKASRGVKQLSGRKRSSSSERRKRASNTILLPDSLKRLAKLTLNIPSAFIEVANKLKHRIYIKDSNRKFVFANNATLNAHGVADLRELQNKQDEHFFEGGHLMMAANDEEMILQGELDRIDDKIEWETWKSKGGEPGRLTFVVSTKIPLLNARGKIVGLLGIARDTQQPHVGNALDPGTSRTNVGMYVREVNYSSHYDAKREKEVVRRNVQVWYSAEFFNTFPGKTFAERRAAVHEKDRRRVTRFLASINHKKGIVHNPLSHRTAVFRVADNRSGAAHNKWRWIQVVAYTEPNPVTKVPRLVVVHYDADKGRAEELLGLQIIKESPLFVFAKDSEKRHEYMNPALLRFFGKQLHEVVGLRDQDLDIPLEQAKKFEEDDDEVIAGRSVVRRHEKLSVNGQLIDLLTAKVPLNPDIFLPSGCETPEESPNERQPKQYHILGVAADASFIAAEKEAQKLLSETLIDKTRDGISVKSADLKFVVVNRAFAEFFGKPTSAFPGKTLEEVLADQLQQDPLLAKQLEAIKQSDLTVLHGARTEVHESRIIEFDGKPAIRTRTRKMRLDKFDDSEGQYILSISSDITSEFLAEFVPPQIRGTQFATPTQKGLCVMFADIRNFTETTDRLAGEPTMVHQLLDYWHSRVEDLALEASAQGTDCVVDKFVGDGVMLLFGSLTADGSAEHRIRCCEDACAFALTLQTEFQRICDDWRRECEQQVIKVIPPMKLGVGICYGKVLVGTFHVGSRSNRRMHFTAIGGAVNTASRLEGIAGKNRRIAKNKKTMLRPDLLVHKNVALNLGGRFELTELFTEELMGLEDVEYRGLIGIRGTKADTNH